MNERQIYTPLPISLAFLSSFLLSLGLFTCDYITDIDLCTDRGKDERLCALVIIMSRFLNEDIDSKLLLSFSLTSQADDICPSLDVVISHTSLW